MSKRPSSRPGMSDENSAGATRVFGIFSIFALYFTVSVCWRSGRVCADAVHIHGPRLPMYRVTTCFLETDVGAPKSCRAPQLSVSLENGLEELPRAIVARRREVLLGMPLLDDRAVRH